MAKINAKESVLLVCDIQESFRGLMMESSRLILSTKLLLEAAKLFHIPVVVTEQYPKGLGHTVPELLISRQPSCCVFEKTKFSMVTPDVKTHLESLGGRRTAILCGGETHVCVQQTALDLVELGWSVHLPVDAVSSRGALDRQVAFERLRQSGVVTTTAESVVFEWLEDKDRVQFKAVSNLIRQFMRHTSAL